MKSCLMKVNLRIRNMPISLREKVDKTIEKEVEDTIKRKIMEVTMIRIVLTRPTRRSMMINHQLRKVRKKKTYRYCGKTRHVEKV
jgi:hypothetical protein